MKRLGPRMLMWIINTTKHLTEIGREVVAYNYVSRSVSMVSSYEHGNEILRVINVGNYLIS